MLEEPDTGLELPGKARFRGKEQYSLSLKLNTHGMQIERNTDDKITITLSSRIDGLKLQRLIDYIKYLELTSKSKATQSDADRLADEVNATWWEKNHDRFIG